MDSKLASFLKEMRSMDYADEKPAKNPPPNGITAAEIEAISTKTYDSSEQQETPHASEAPPTGGVTYWQALVDPNTNLTYYWNSQTNEVSWTLPEGGVITLPAASEQVEAKEKELEAALESYPYSATIAAEFIKPVTTTTTTTTATAATDNGTSSPLPKSGTKRPQSSPGKPLESEAAPSVKKSRLSYDDRSSPTTTSSAEDKPSVVPASQALPEEKMKAQVNNMVALLSKKLQSLQSSAPNSSQLETLAIQLQTRQADWNEGGVTTKYMLEKLRKMNEDIFMLESSLLAGDQGLISDNESTAVSAEAGTGELSEESRVPGVHESEQQPGLLVSEQPGPLTEEETTEVDPQVSQPADREGAVSQSTGEMECSGSSAALYSRVSFPQDFPEEAAAESPSPCPPEVVGPSLPAASGVTSEAKVEPETGMPEGDLAHREEEKEEMVGEVTGDHWREAAQGWRSWRGEGLEEKELRESNTWGKEKTETYGVEDVARDVDSERIDSRDKMDYDRMVEDVTDKEDDENSSDDNHKSSSVVQPQAELKEEGVSSEEEGVWVEPGKERSEGELLDDSSDSSDDDASSEDRKQGDRKKFGPREESSGKKKQVENYEKSEGELDQDSEDEKSEGELDDDKEEVWAERTDYNADRGSHSHRRQNYRPQQVARDQDSDYSDYSSSRRDRRDHRHYDSDYSDEYYSSRKNRHYRREHKNYNRSRDRYRDDSDYSDEYYTSSHRHDRGGRYDEGYEQEYYNKRSHYGNKSSSRSGKGYSGGGGGSSSNRYQRSRHSYDSDNERDYDRRRHHSSSKHRKRDRDKDKERKKKLDRWGSSQNKDSEGDEKKPAASVLIGKVGKISTVRPLGKEKKAEEGADSSKTGESTASTTTSVPPGGAAVGVPPPMPPTTEMPAYQPMSATYYQHPSTGEVPYYPTYGTAYHQYPAYSAAQTYQQPPPPPTQQDEVQEEEQKQQQEEGGWVWITNADGTPQWVRADSAAAASAKQKDDDAKEKKKKQEEDGSLESQQKKWGEVNPAQWGGADPVQWASMHAAAPPLPPEEPKPEEPKPEEPSPEEPRPPATEQDEETSAMAGEEGMCSSKVSLVGEEQQQLAATTDQLPVSAEGQPIQSLDTTEATQVAGVISDRPDVNQLRGASFSFEAPPPEFVGAESSQAPPLPPSEPDVIDGEQKAEEEIVDCEMEIESNHGSPVASDESTVPPLPSNIAGDNSTSGQADNGLPAESNDSNALPAGDLPGISSSQQTAEGLNPSVPSNPVPPSASAELATTNTEAAQGDPSHVPVAATAVESSTEPTTQLSVAPSVTSSAAVVTQAASVASSSAVYYPSTAAAAPPPPVDTASYSYAAAYGQPAYNYAYAQSYNYAYMQPTAYGAYGMQAGAPAYYPYPTPAAGVYGTYPPTYYAATTYSSVPPPPTYQPPMSTVGAATSGVHNTTQLAKSGTKEKSTKTMLEEWTAFKEGQGKS